MSNEKEEKTQRYTDKIIEVAYYNFPLVPSKDTVNKAVYALLDEYKQSEPTVDLTELRKEFERHFVGHIDNYDRSDFWEFFKDYIQPKQDKESEWISVEDRLPTERVETLLVFNGDAPEYNQHAFIACYFSQTKSFKSDSKFMGTITHWQPLTPIPKQTISK